MPRPLPYLIVLSRHALALSQEELATLVGSSLRSVQRWETKQASPMNENVHALSDAVRTRDPALADELDAWAPRPPPPGAPSPPAGLAPSPPSPLPVPAPASVPAAVLVDAVVCAAAEAMQLPPQAVRPALTAAFLRARDAGLGVEAALSVLAPPPAAPEGAGSGAAKGSSAKKRG
jgi:DNA-binding XRE family transcriptional regulator